ncbi:MAG: alpha/beta hydrolase [Myxococcales bacterium]
MQIEAVADTSSGALRVLGPLDVPGLQARNVRVWLPPGFRRGTHTPVLYMFDGQNVFDDGPSYSGGWYVHEALERLGAKLPRLPVVVGIDHGGERRLDELSPFQSHQSQGHADRLLAWMTRALVPAVARELRLLTGREETFIGGSSMGGLCSLYALFRHPEVFAGAMCMSPSFWFADGRIFSWLEERPLPPAARLYLDCGAREGRSMLPPTERMADYLTKRGFPRTRLLFKADPRGTHSEKDWRRRLPGALRFLFGADANTVRAR